MEVSVQQNTAEDMGRGREQNEGMAKREGGWVTMDMQQKIREIISDLKSLEGAETVTVNHPAIRDGAGILGFNICKPYPPQWPYYHVLMPGRGVCRLSIGLLIDRLNDKLKEDSE